MKLNLLLTLLFAALIGVTAGCGGEGADQANTNTGGEAGSGLTPAQIENGVGPVTELVLGEIDPALAAKGEAEFQLKCSACHKMDKRYVGPALGDVMSRRSPAYVMNMILNPEGMLKEHPEAKKLLAEFMTPMANQNLTEEQARSIVEYFRTAVAEAPSDEESEG